MGVGKIFTKMYGGSKFFMVNEFFPGENMGSEIFPGENSGSIGALVPLCLSFLLQSFVSVLFSFSFFDFFV